MTSDHVLRLILFIFKLCYLRMANREYDLIN